MILKKQLKFKLKEALIGCFLGILGIFGLLSGTVANSTPVYAVPENATVTMEAANNGGDGCKDSLGAIGWLVCPTTGKISEAVDWLYDKIENILTISPTPAEDGSPIYEVWKYIKGVTNIAFIIFLLVVIYSQITGLGINNYGIKKALPKLIVAAVMVNLSFIVCQLAVDVSNIIGDGLRGVFTSVAEAAIPAGSAGVSGVSYAGMYAALAGGGALAIGAGVIAFETGAIWMLIPMALGALVAVVSGLITIALRQAVVALLIMVSPLAMVANILPNTEQWFKKWKDLLFKMLVFYPMFSLLFGASQLAGFAIIASAKDGFGVLLGTAVQIFPLFFSWSLMKMSGTVLGTINSKLNSLAAGSLATNRAWADSHRQLTRAKHLERNRTPSMRLMSFIERRKAEREADLDDMNKVRKARYTAARDLSNYTNEGNLSRKGRERFKRQELSMRYGAISEMHKNNLNEGFSSHEADYKKTIAGMKKDFRKVRGVYSTAVGNASKLDIGNMNASDDLKFEMARGAVIDYRNAQGFQKRVTDAMNAHYDQNAEDEKNVKYQPHGALEDKENMVRYNRIRAIMEGKEADVHFAAMDAAATFNAQAQVMRNKFQTYTDLTPATQDVVTRLSELTTRADSSSYIDPIIAGLRTLNMRGDTDVVRSQIENILKEDKVKLGTYTSQALANFCMFEVKGGDPFLRRLGKYINLETAAMYNENDPEKRRQKQDVTIDEYVNGEYIDHYTDEGVPVVKNSKKDASVLLNGTSFKDMERTAIKNMTETIREHSVDENGNFDMAKFMENEKKIWNAITPNIIGDQFSFLSGSEQIIALSKGLTGVDVGKRQIDWEGIFGKDIAKNLTPEQKADYLEFLNKRTKTFLGGHVPVQIARTKSDMLDAVITQYALRDKIREGVEYEYDEEEKRDRAIKVNEDFLNINHKDDFKTFKEERLDGVRKEFVGSLNNDSLKGFAKMYQKGYQGEAKAGLIELLKDELDRQVYKDAKEQRERKRKFEEEEGMPVNVDTDGAAIVGGEVYSDARRRVEDIYNKYRRDLTPNAVDFWDEIKDVIGNPAAMGGDDLAVDIAEFGDGVSEHTNIHELYSRAMKRFFKVTD